MSDTKMTINEQVEYLMQGTEYGDDVLKRAMADELMDTFAGSRAGGTPVTRILRF